MKAGHNLSLNITVIIILSSLLNILLAPAWGERGERREEARSVSEVIPSRDGTSMPRIGYFIPFSDSQAEL